MGIFIAGLFMDVHARDGLDFLAVMIIVSRK